MFFHRKELISGVQCDAPDAAFGQKLLEQFGGATGELTAALTYWVQSFHVENAGIRDMLQDIALEEFSHLEMVGKLIEMHTTGVDQTAAYKSSLFSVRGMGPHFVDSNGVGWSAAYINEGGNVVRDLRSDIAAEAGARQTYEALIKIAPDAGTKKTLHTLLTREIAHTKMFMTALQSLDKLDDPMFGNVPPDDTVKLYFNLSKDDEEKDIRGPWNDEKTFDYLSDPQPQGEMPEDPANPDDEGSAVGPEGIARHAGKNSRRGRASPRTHSRVKA